MGSWPAVSICHSVPFLLPPPPACNELDGISKALAPRLVVARLVPRVAARLAALLVVARLAALLALTLLAVAQLLIPVVPQAVALLVVAPQAV